MLSNDARAPIIQPWSKHRSSHQRNIHRSCIYIPIFDRWNILSNNSKNKTKSSARGTYQVIPRNLWLRNISCIPRVMCWNIVSESLSTPGLSKKPFSSNTLTLEAMKSRAVPRNKLCMMSYMHVCKCHPGITLHSDTHCVAM